MDFLEYEDILETTAKNLVITFNYFPNLSEKDILDLLKKQFKEIFLKPEDLSIETNVGSWLSTSGEIYNGILDTLDEQVASNEDLGKVMVELYWALRKITLRYAEYQKEKIK